MNKLTFNQYEFFKNCSFRDNGGLVVKISNKVPPETKAENQYEFFRNVDTTENKEVKVTIKK